MTRISFHAWKVNKTRGRWKKLKWKGRSERHEKGGVDYGLGLRRTEL